MQGRKFVGLHNLDEVLAEQLQDGDERGDQSAEADRAFVEELEGLLPPGLPLERVEANAEDPEFVQAAVERLIGLIEGGD